VYWILFWGFVSLAATRNPLWVALLAVPLAPAAVGWYLCGIKGRPPERGAAATLGLLDLAIVGLVAVQHGVSTGADGGVIRAGIGFPIVMWMACGLPTPRFGLPTRGKHARRLIALTAMALVVSAGVEWSAGLLPSLTKGGTPPMFWPLFLAPLPFYLTPLWSVLSDGWRAHNTEPRLPGLTELWELPAPDERRPLSDRERLVRLVLQAESDAYLILLNRLDDPQITTSRLRIAEREVVRSGELPPPDNRAVQWTVERLVQLTMRLDAPDNAGSHRLLLRDTLDNLAPEAQSLLVPWLIGGVSFAELSATSGLSSAELRCRVREGLAELTEAADRRLRGDSLVVASRRS
jgi:hypothetical protein